MTRALAPAKADSPRNPPTHTELEGRGLADCVRTRYEQVSRKGTNLFVPIRPIKDVGFSPCRHIHSPNAHDSPANCWRLAFAQNPHPFLILSSFFSCRPQPTTAFSPPTEALHFTTAAFKAAGSASPARSYALTRSGGEGAAYHDADSKNNGSGALDPADGSYLNEFRMAEGVTDSTGTQAAIRRSTTPNTTR